MLLEQTYAKLVEMKLYGMANAIKERLERVDHQSLSKEEFVGVVLHRKLTRVLHRKLTRLSEPNYGSGLVGLFSLSVPPRLS